jgi:hypothetical protein
MNEATSLRLRERKLAWCPAARQFKPVHATGTPGAARPPAFIKGPLPLDWMQRAACLPGKTLQVSLTLWYLAGLQKTRTVRLGSKHLAAMGVSRDAKAEALTRLCDAALVHVDQQPGQAPMVTLLPVESVEGGAQ